MSASQWALYGALLVAQNISFTFVSRARNSGSLKRHLIAALVSNGVWFFTQLMTLSAFMGIISGRSGFAKAMFAGLFYTAMTCAGSLLAHYIALRTEKGKAAVGASAKYAQITAEEWNYVKELLLIK